MSAKCYECRAGDHEDYDDDVAKVTVRDPDGGRPKVGFLCGEHRAAARDDGMEVS
jgi:hypothetical protein